MNFVKHYDQREDGGFDHYVVFGDFAPWDAPDENCVKCATESDADKLMGFLLEMTPNEKLQPSANRLQAPVGR